MAKISKVKQVTALHGKVVERINHLRAQLAAAEAEERKLAITLEVLRTLEDDFVDEDDDEENFITPTAVVNHSRLIAPASHNIERRSKGVRGMIIDTFKAGEAKNSLGVYKALRVNGHEPNQNTINSTLSKLVKEGILIKASQSSYLLNVESPAA